MLCLTEYLAFFLHFVVHNRMYSNKLIAYRANNQQCKVPMQAMNACKRTTFRYTIILPVVLYACGNWSLTMRKECRLRVSENRVLRRICGP